MQEKFLKDGRKNMEYRVKLTEQFLGEFEEICAYISNKLKNIDASNRLREKAIYNILLLENSPRMCTEIEKVDVASQIVNALTVNDFGNLFSADAFG